MRKLLFAATALVGLSLAPAANATLISQLSVDGGATFQNICTAASGTSCGSLAFTTSNNLAFTIFGVSSNSPGTAIDADLLQATVKLQNVGTTTSSIILRVSDTGYTSPTAPPAGGLTLINNIAGTVTVGGAANLFSSDACVNGNNNQNACGTGSPHTTPLINANITAPGTGSNSDTLGIASLVGPFSMEEILNITLAAGSTVNFSTSADLVPVSEPATIAILGLGILGLAFVSSRKRRHVDAGLA